MIDGKILANAVLKTILIRIVLGLLGFGLLIAASFYYQDWLRVHATIVSGILYGSMGVVAVFFHMTQDTSHTDELARRHSYETVRNAVDQVEASWPVRFRARRLNVIFSLKQAKRDLELAGIYTLSEAIDSEIERLEKEAA